MCQVTEHAADTLAELESAEAVQVREGPQVASCIASVDLLDAAVRAADAALVAGLALSLQAEDFRAFASFSVPRLGFPLHSPQ